MTRFFSWHRLTENFPQLVAYFPITFEIVFFAVTAGIFLGTIIAVIRINKIPVLKQFCAVFVSFMRCTPMLVQMLVSYYAAPMILEAVFGIDSRRWPPLVFVVITFILNQAAFLSEIIRSSIIAVSAGQWDAALSCGLTPFQTFLRIIMPQAFRIAVPSLSLDVVGVFESTSLVYMVGVMDVIGRAQAIATATNHIIECYIIITVFFVSVSFIIRFLFGSAEKKLNSSMEK